MIKNKILSKEILLLEPFDGHITRAHEMFCSVAALFMTVYCTGVLYEIA